MPLDETQVRWFRLQRSGLTEPFSSPEEASRALAGVQAQILPAAGLALWNRSPALTYEQVDSLLHERRSLVKLWGQRHTLHLYATDEWPLIIGALSGQPSWWERQVGPEGSETHRALVDRVAELLRERGTLGRTDLRAAVDLELDEYHLSAWGGIFGVLVRRGLACHAGRDGNEGRFAHREHWLPDLEWNPPSTDEANETLARRYFRTYGPATVQDFAYWRGVRVMDARRWVAGLGDEIVDVTVDGQAMLALRDDLETLHAAPPPREAWPVRLLYRFDPLLLGQKDKSWIVELAHYNRVWRPAGHIEGTLVEHGRIAGTWRYDRRGGQLVITVSPFAPLPAHVPPEIERHAEGVAAFFGLELADLVYKPVEP